MKKKHHLILGFVAGIATIMIVRLGLVLLTQPHSVIAFPLETLWHWPVALLAGVVVLLMAHRSPKRISTSSWIFAVGACLVAGAGLWLVRDIDLMNHLIAGFWVK